MRAKALGAVIVVLSLVLLAALAFVKANTDTQAASLCGFYQKENLNMENCPAHKSSTSWLITVLFGMGFAVLGIGAYLVFAGENISAAKAQKHAANVDTDKMGEEEKKVFEALKQGSGSAYQSDLIKETGLSKVRVTRVLDKLESKGLVERKRRGMTNIVVLK